MKIKSFLAACIAALTLSACTSAPETTEPVENVDPSAIVAENIMTRRSIRKYQETTLSRDTLQKIVELGVQAPSGMNRQSWELRVIDNPELIAEINTLYQKSLNKDDAQIFYGAPAVVVIANDPAYEYSLVDCGLLGGNIVHAAWSMGVGSCIMAIPARFMNTTEEAKPWIEKLGFSEGYEIQYCISLGYPAETPEARPRDLNKIKFVEK